MYVRTSLYVTILNSYGRLKNFVMTVHFSKLAIIKMENKNDRSIAKLFTDFSIYAEFSEYAFFTS